MISYRTFFQYLLKPFQFGGEVVHVLKDTEGEEFLTKSANQCIVGIKKDLSGTFRIVCNLLFGSNYTKAVKSKNKPQAVFCMDKQEWNWFGLSPEEVEVGSLPEYDWIELTKKETKWHEFKVFWIQKQNLLKFKQSKWLTIEKKTKDKQPVYRFFKRSSAKSSKASTLKYETFPESGFVEYLSIFRDFVKKALYDPLVEAKKQLGAQTVMTRVVAQEVIANKLPKQNGSLARLFTESATGTLFLAQLNSKAPAGSLSSMKP